MSQEVPANQPPEGYRPAEYLSPGYNFSVPFPPQPPQYAAPSQPVRRRQRRWIIMGILVALLIASIATFFVVKYVTRSTPNKTLDTFCTALQQGNYHTAYNQFSPRFQHTIAETAFAAIFSQDKVSACTHGSTDDAGSSVSDTLKLVHVSQSVNNDIVMLTKDSSEMWKIDDISRQ